MVSRWVCCTLTITVCYCLFLGDNLRLWLLSLCYRVTPAAYTTWCQLTFRSLGAVLLHCRSGPLRSLHRPSHHIYLEVCIMYCVKTVCRLMFACPWNCSLVTPRFQQCMSSDLFFFCAGAAAAAVMSSSKTVLRPATGASAGPGQPTVQHIIHQTIQVN